MGIGGPVVDMVEIPGNKHGGPQVKYFIQLPQNINKTKEFLPLKEITSNMLGKGIV